MKKGFLFTALFFSSQIFGVQFANGVPSVLAELLVWQAQELSNDNWGQVLGPTGTNQQIQFLEIPFKFSPGIRVGAGYSDKNNLWNILFYYTGYQTLSKKHASITNGEIHSAFLGNFFAENVTGAGISGPYYHQAGINWKILFTNLDLELGRSIKIDNLLNLRPFIGLKAGMINQSINSNWQEPYNNSTKMPITTYSLATEKITNNFTGLGPSFGVDTTWHLYDAPKHALNLIGNFSGAFLWGRWVLKDVYQNNTPVSITVMNDTLFTAASMARAYVGIEWEGIFNQTNLNMSLGYEGQAWFNQLRYYSFDMGGLNDSLFFHGAVLQACFHF